MAVTENISKISIKAQYANGMNSDGTTKLANVNFPAVSPTGYTVALAWGFYTSLLSIISLTPMGLIASKTYLVDDDD